MYKIRDNKPEVFDALGMNHQDMVMRLAANFCIPTTKLHAKMHREGVAYNMEHYHTQDLIRRTYNQGDAFHPYL